MAAVKTERRTAGFVTPPKRPKDWVAPAVVIRVSGSAPVPTEPIPQRQPQTDEEKAAMTAYDAACKALGQCKPNDTGAENARGVAYARLVRLGLRPQLRGRYRS